MKQIEKEQLVSELKDKIKGAKALYFTDFTGLNVKRMTELRRRFQARGRRYVVIKNTLALRAVNESGLTGARSWSHGSGRGEGPDRRCQGAGGLREGK